MDDNALYMVRKFISDFLKIDMEKLTEKTTLYKDLGIDGDDAVDFMEAFSKKFNVDLSTFVFDKYFGSEGFNPLISFWKFLVKRKKVTVEQISIENLVEAVKRHKWSQIDK